VKCQAVVIHAENNLADYFHCRSIICRLNHVSILLANYCVCHTAIAYKEVIEKEQGKWYKKEEGRKERNEMCEGLIEIYKRIPDPRTGYNIRHNLGEVLTIATLAIMCGMDCFTDMEMFGIEQEEWLRKYMVLENGIPSHDTFGDIFAAIEPHAISTEFTNWAQTIRENINREVVAIDGKTICASKDIPKKKKAVHVVSAWASANRLILGEVATSEKSNEITAIPELLKMLELKGCIVTIDAMGTQTKIAQAIIDKEADYVLPVKENHEQLYNDIKLYFDTEDKPLDTASTQEKAHGRIEKRECAISRDIDWLDPEGRWAKLAGIAKITSQTQNLSHGTTECSTQYLIFSGRDLTAAQILSSKRAHWGVESMHWSLDIAFREDECRARVKNAANVFNALRHFTLNLLSLENSSKGGIASKRKRCAISTSYRSKVLSLL
jgi:predicted transposase YbfD/YdcC